MTCQIWPIQGRNTVGAACVTHFSVISTMDTRPKPIRVGCQVTLPATRFDDPECERWSVQQFGAEADTRVLQCTIVARVRDLFRVHVAYDGTFYTLEEEALTHTALTCRSCWPTMEVTTPSAPPSLATGSEGAAASPIGGSAAGTAFCNFTEPLDGDSDDEIGLAELAQLALQRCPPASLADSDYPMPPEHLRGAEFGAQLGRVGREATRASDHHVQDVAWDSASEEDLPDLTDQDSDSDSEVEESSDEENSCGRGRVRGGRARGVGGANRGHGLRRARSPQHSEDINSIKRHRLVWTKGEGRTICPMQSGRGYSATARLTLYGSHEASVLKYFEHCYLCDTIPEMAVGVERTARHHGKSNFVCSPGSLWLFFALKLFMLIHPQEGDKELYWHVPEDMKERVCSSHTTWGNMVCPFPNTGTSSGS